MENYAKNLLLVEDDALIAMAEKQQLAKIGYTVDHVLTGEAAVSYALDTNTRPDLILMDIDLGTGIEGTEAARQILNEIDIPVVFLSSHAEPEVVEKTERITSYGYVVKNSGITVLNASIKMAFKLFDAKIQEQKKEESLRQSEHKYKTLFNEMLDGFALHEIICDSSGEPVDYRFLDVNPAFERITGLKATEIVGRTVLEVLPETEKNWIDNYGKVALSGEPIVFGSYSAALGKYFNVSAVCPAINQFACVFEDITEWSQTEEALRESSAKLDLFFSQSLQGFFFMTLEKPVEWNDTVNKDAALEYMMHHGHITRVNQAMLDQYGAEEDDFIGITPYELFEHDPEQGYTLLRSISDNRYMHLETSERRMDGAPIVINGAYTCIYDQEGRITGNFGVQMDITERKEIERNLRKQEAMYRSLMENSIDGVYLMNWTGEILQVNNTACEMLGYSRKELLQLTIDDVDPNYPSQQFIKFWNDKPEGTTVLFETIHRRKDGKDLLVEVNGIFFILDDTKYLFGVSRDITERKQAEEKLKEQNTDLRLKESAIEYALSGIVFNDLQGNVFFANDALVKMFGWESQDDVYGKTVLDAHPEEEFEKLSALFETIKKDGYATAELTAKKKNGDLFDVRLAASLVPDEAGNPLCVMASFEDITERRQMENTLHESVARYDELVALVPVGIYIVWIRANGTKDFEYVSARWCSIHGICEKDVLANANAVDDLVHPDDREPFIERNQEAARERKPFLWEGRFFSGDGTLRWLRIEAIPMVFENGDIRWFGVTRDITERKQAEEALIEGEKRISSIFRSSPTGIGLVVDRVLQAVNTRVCRMTGFEEHELLGQSARILYPSDDEFEFVGREKYAQIKDHGTGSVETRWRKKDGTVIDVLLSSTPLDMEDVSKGVTFTALDITERKRTVAELQESKERFDLAIENTEAGVWDWDLINDEVFYSTQWKSMLGYADHEVENSFSGWKNLWHPDDRIRIEKTLADYLNGKTNRYEIIHRCRHKNGEWRWIQTRGDIIRDAKGQSVRWVGTNIDITELKHAEEEIQRQLTEKETLLQEVHHRIKNNMAQVESLLSIQADSADSAEVKSALKKAMARVRSTRTLYEKLLIGKGYEKVSMKEYLESLIDSLVDVFNDRSGITVEKRIVDFPLDAKRAIPVGIMLNELLTNVFKYAFTGRGSGHVSIQLEKNETRVILSVTDDGAGLDKRVEANTSPGFGLTLVNMLAEQLDGTFSIESDNGTRSVVEFEV